MSKDPRKVKAGRALVEKRGVAHMRQIGKVGFETTVARHWNGDRQSYIKWLSRKGLKAQDPAPWNGAWQRA